MTIGSTDRPSMAMSTQRNKTTYIEINSLNEAWFSLISLYCAYSRPSPNAEGREVFFFRIRFERIAYFQGPLFG